ncbi:MAG: hypothetical protein ACI82A_002954 [Candidatus Azotimanducaceae bacterium]
MFLNGAVIGTALALLCETFELKVDFKEITMFKAARLAAILLSSTALSGCVVAIGNDGFGDDEQWEETQKRNDRYIGGSVLGSSITAVQADLGEPNYRESFQREGDTFEVLYYRTQHRHSDGQTTKDETTPMVFIDGKLVGYGASAIENATR